MYSEVLQSIIKSSIIRHAHHKRETMIGLFRHKFMSYVLLAFILFGKAHHNAVVAFTFSTPTPTCMIIRSHMRPSCFRYASYNFHEIDTNYHADFTALKASSSNSSSSINSSRRNDDIYLDTSSSRKNNVDVLILRASSALRRSSWFSWWAQIILTVVSSVTLIFAKSVLENSGSAMAKSGGLFLFAGTGIVLSIFSIFWTWGRRRLGRRLVRRSTSRIVSANIIRRAASIGVVLNLLGIFFTILGAEQIIGTLATKVLALQGVVPFGQPGNSLSAAPTLQPLDILIVQANTNTLFSHFVSLVCTLYLNRWIDRLDPPSDDDM